MSYKLAVLLVAVSACIGCGTSNDVHTEPTSETAAKAPNVSAPSRATPPPEFRKELFEKALRAAIDFKPSSGIASGSLQTELKILEAAARGEGEVECLKIFRLLSEVQTDLTLLQSGKVATSQVATGYQTLNADVLNLIKANNPRYYQSMAAISAVNQRGDVVVYFGDGIGDATERAAHASVNQAAQVLAARIEARTGIKAMQVPGSEIRFIPYGNTKSALESMNAALAKTAAELVYNGGSLRK
jgi:hypothetical protein